MLSGSNADQTCSGNLQHSSMGTQLVGGSGKIRLICSSCNQEFASTSELNEHMERHNSEIDEALLQHTASSSISTASSTIIPMVVSTTYTQRQPRSLVTSASSGEVHNISTNSGVPFRNQISVINHQKT